MVKTVAKRDTIVKEESSIKESRNEKTVGIRFDIKMNLEKINIFMPMIYRNCDKKKKEFG